MEEKQASLQDIVKNDYQDTPAPMPSNDVDIADDPFADFGDNVSIDDNFLE